MEVTKRTVALVLWVVACSTPLQDLRERGAASAASPKPGPASVPVVLAVAPQSTMAAAVLDGFEKEVAGTFRVAKLETTPATSVQELAMALKTQRPACLLLLNNTNIRLYGDYQRQQPNGTRFPPSVVVMASYFESLRSSLQNATGIAYELPAATIFAKLRTFFGRHIDTIGVVHRQRFSRFIERQRHLARTERLAIVGAQVSEAPSPRQMRRAIAKVRKQGAQALWVLNDDRLLANRELLTYGWSAGLRSNPLPTVVGVRALVGGDLRLGWFGMLPDHRALGAQAAGLVFELADADWNADNLPVEQPLSVESVADVSLLATDPSFKRAALSRVDQVVQ